MSGRRLSLRGSSLRVVVMVVLVLIGGAAGRVTQAQPSAPQPAPPQPATDERAVSGVAVPEKGAGADQDSSLARPLLFVPRLAVGAVGIPIREGLRVYERNHVRERVIDIFFDDERTFGIYPVVSLETGLSPRFGARLIHKSVAGTGVRLRISGDYGGELRRRLDGGLTSPAWGRSAVRLQLRGGWQSLPDASFYGIGDAPLRDAPGPETGLPARAPSAFNTRFHESIQRAELALRTNLPGLLEVRGAAGYFRRRFGDADLRGGSPSDQTAVRFDPTTLTGWQQGSQLAYQEVQLSWDHAPSANPYLPAGPPAHGTKLGGFVGWSNGLGGDPARYLRYGLDAFQFVDLYGGDRVLSLRAHLEGVAGDEDRIPFTDLPRLGGAANLRGFVYERFRDRVAVLGAVEYRYPILPGFDGFLFVDAGRVLPSTAQLAPHRLFARWWRIGGGGGLQVLQGNRFRGRLQAAGSEEGLFLQLSLEPAYRVQTPSYRI